MAKLIMTEEERRSQTFLEWDDASLGVLTKRMAQIMGDDHGRDASAVTGAAVFLIANAVDNGAAVFEVGIEGAVDGDRQLGNWKITIEKQ